MALICLPPLSASCAASFPHVHLLESAGGPPAPNPILNSQETQSFDHPLPRMPILTLVL